MSYNPMPALGQTTKAASLPVVPPTDPDLRPNAVTITAQDVASSSASGQNSASIITGAPTANSSQAQAVNGQSAARIQLSGTWTGTIQFEGSADGGTTWTPVPARVIGSSYTQSAVTGNGLFLVDLVGLTNLRARATAAWTGTANARFTFSAAAGATMILNPMRLFDNASGAQATIKPASTAPATTDTSLVTALNPNAPPLGTNGSAAPGLGVLVQGSDGTNARNLGLDALGGLGIIGSRPGLVKYTLGPLGGASYTTGLCIGALQQIQLTTPAGVSLPSGQILTACVIRLLANGTTVWTAGVGNVQIYFFDANPSGSTTGDTTTFALADADIPKTRPLSVGSGNSTNGMGNIVVAASARFKLDTSGKLIFSIVASNTNTFAASSSLNVEIDYLY